MAEIAGKITTVCPGCNKSFSVNSELLGRKVRCKCGQTFVIEEKLDTAIALDQPEEIKAQTLSAPAYSPRILVEPGQMCANHPEVAAVQRCSKCNAAVCATCVFDFPNHIHLCPACATDTSVQLSSGRKVRVGIAIALAVWVTIAISILFLGLLPKAHTKDEVGMIGLMIMGLGILPAVVGLGFSLAAVDRRRGNTPIVWVALVWNGVLCAAWALLMTMGMMKNH